MNKGSILLERRFMREFDGTPLFLWAMEGLKYIKDYQTRVERTLVQSGRPGNHKR